MKTPGWLWVYDALAIYGLRPHEIFQLSTDRLNEEPAPAGGPERENGQEVSVSDGCRLLGV